MLRKLLHEVRAYSLTCIGTVFRISGKSYTMGTDTVYAATDGVAAEERLGIIPRAVQQIFRELEAKVRESGRRLKVDTTNSYVEIYSESRPRLDSNMLEADESTRSQMKTSLTCSLATWT